LRFHHKFRQWDRADRDDDEVGKGTFGQGSE
jgi:hypothetical protein